MNPAAVMLRFQSAVAGHETSENPEAPSVLQTREDAMSKKPGSSFPKLPRKFAENSAEMLAEMLSGSTVTIIIETDDDRLVIERGVVRPRTAHIMAQRVTGLRETGG
jgi:hypothetical protein